MKVLALACFVAVCGIALAGLAQEGHLEHVVEKAWEIKYTQYLREYEKQYDDQDEFTRRFNLYKENTMRISKHNARQDVTYQLGESQFTDWSWNEFKARYLMAQAPQDCSATGKMFTGSESQLPTSVDWRKKHVVTHVKDQGQCGSCWTFSTTGAMESHWAIATGDLPLLAEQQLVDCAGAFNNHGCNGGLPSQAFEYIHYAGGIMTEKDYPYTAKDGVCKFNVTKTVAHSVRAFNVSQDDEVELTAMVAYQGPVSIAYEVVDDFMHYKSGVYSSTKCGKTPKDVNHAVLAVGYDVTPEGVPYFIVKNSWGTSWGSLGGYFWIKRGDNMCGLATCAAYPVVGY